MRSSRNEFAFLLKILLSYSEPPVRGFARTGGLSATAVDCNKYVRLHRSARQAGPWHRGGPGTVALKVRSNGGQKDSPEEICEKPCPSINPRGCGSGYPDRTFQSQRFPEIIRRDGVGSRCHVCRGAGKHDFTAGDAAVWPHVNEPVRLFHHIQIVLDDDDGIAAFH